MVCKNSIDCEGLMLFVGILNIICTIQFMIITVDDNNIIERRTKMEKPDIRLVLQHA
jgi:hypothetical protein